MQSTTYTKQKTVILLSEEALQSLKNSIPLGDTPLWEYWDQYVSDFRNTKRSEDTIANTASALHVFLTYSELITIESWFVQRKVQDEFFRLAKEKNWSEGTYNSYRKNVSSYFNHLIRVGYIDKNPVLNIMKMPGSVKDQPSISNNDVRKVFRYLENEFTGVNLMQRLRNKLFFTFALGTGARPKELLRLRLDSLSSNRQEVTIETAKLSGKKRSYPLDQKTKDLITLYIQQVAICGRSKELDKNLFVGIKQGKSWGYSGVRKACNRITAATGIPIEMYMFRRHAATEMFDNGIPIQDIQHLMGHTRSSTTYGYIQSRPSMNQKGTSLLLGLLTDGVGVSQ